jgi:hypothetical protein
MRKRKVVVVTGVPTDGCAFDEDGLSELAGLDVAVDVQGIVLDIVHCSDIDTWSVRLTARSLSRGKERKL